LSRHVLALEKQSFLLVPTMRIVSFSVRVRGSQQINIITTDEENNIITKYNGDLQIYIVIILLYWQCFVDENVSIQQQQYRIMVVANIFRNGSNDD